MKERLQQLIGQLQQGLIERDEPARLALLAALAGEHLLLLGPPGTAKSELARKLQSVFAGGHYFERLLTKFSVPEELFGPLSIKALESDRYQRLTEGYLPSASIAFIDEIFKANSAILNALLTLLNEREFDNGAERHKTPLIAVIGASNELPEGEELDALYDRFLLRYQVSPVSNEGFEALMALDETTPHQAEEIPRLTHEDLIAIQQQAQAIPLSADLQQLLKDCRRYCSEQQRYVSDRRWRKIIKLLKVAALTSGHTEADVWDGWLLQHCLWDVPEQRTDIHNWYQSHLGTHAVLNPERLERLTQTWEHTVADEESNTEQLRNEHGDPLYLDPAGKLTTESCRHHAVSINGDARYLAPPEHPNRENNGQGYSHEELQEQFFDEHYQQCHINGHWVSLSDYTANKENRLITCEDYTPHTRPVLYSQSHIKDRLRDTQDLINRVGQYRLAISDTMAHLDDTLRDHLWVTQDFVEPARNNLQQSLKVAEQLGERLTRVRHRFEQLPLAKH